jgi:hypothetical protein
MRHWNRVRVDELSICLLEEGIFILDIEECIHESAGN